MADTWKEESLHRIFAGEPSKRYVARYFDINDKQAGVKEVSGSDPELFLFFKERPTTLVIGKEEAKSSLVLDLANHVSAHFQLPLGAVAQVIANYLYDHHLTLTGAT